jgi:AraC family transcriptional regulator
MLPSIAASMSASVGFFVSLSSMIADIICPDWQYPHCTTSSSCHALLTASATFPETPSIVAIGCPAASPTRMEHGAHSLTVEMHGARATLRAPAAKLGSCQVERVAQRPEQRHVRVHLELMDLAVDGQVDHAIAPSRRNVNVSLVGRAVRPQQGFQPGHTPPAATHTLRTSTNSRWAMGIGARFPPELPGGLLEFLMSLPDRTWSGPMHEARVSRRRTDPPAVWDGERYVITEARRAWSSARVLVRTEEISRPRSWKDVNTNHTVIVNLGGLTSHFEAELDDGTRSLEPPTIGDMSIVPAGRAFAGMFQGHTNTYAIWEMPPDDLARLADEVGISRPPEIVPHLAHRDELICRAVERLADLVESTNNLSDLLADSINRTVGLHLIATYDVRAARRPAPTGRQILSPKVTAALQEYIDAHLAEKITLDDLATVADQSIDRLLIEFRQRFGRTPYQYIIAQRLKRARWQLAHTTRPISTIAYDVGFSSPEPSDGRPQESAPV